MIKTLLDRPVPATILVASLLCVTAWGVAHFPRSIVVFMLFQGSIFLLYFARMPRWLKASLTLGTLGVLMPVLGSINAYYMEIAIQVGIFVALALGLNIVVGLAGLLDLGYVAFFAVGVFLGDLRSPQANLIFGGSSSRSPRGGSSSSCSSAGWRRGGHPLAARAPFHGDYLAS
jgi:branched-chain amino acid transport system permease protein